MITISGLLHRLKFRPPRPTPAAITKKRVLDATHDVKNTYNDKRLKHAELYENYTSFGNKFSHGEGCQSTTAEQELGLNSEKNKQINNKYI
uniref:Uncharacterized protein n=1 Tax=Romanomermis culicivorax TaxID=13658 RepID=A0A915I284_ROMCU